MTDLNSFSGKFRLSFRAFSNVEWRSVVNCIAMVGGVLASFEVLDFRDTKGVAVGIYICLCILQLTVRFCDQITLGRSRRCFPVFKGFLSRHIDGKGVGREYLSYFLTRGSFRYLGAIYSAWFYFCSDSILAILPFSFDFFLVQFLVRQRCFITQQYSWMLNRINSVIRVGGLSVRICTFDTSLLHFRSVLFNLLLKTLSDLLTNVVFLVA